MDEKQFRLILIDVLKIIYCLGDVPLTNYAIEAYIMKRLGEPTTDMYTGMGAASHATHDDWYMKDDKRAIIDVLIASEKPIIPRVE